MDAFTDICNDAGFTHGKCAQLGRMNIKLNGYNHSSRKESQYADVLGWPL